MQVASMQVGRLETHMKWALHSPNPCRNPEPRCAKPSSPSPLGPNAPPSPHPHTVLQKLMEVIGGGEGIGMIEGSVKICATAVVWLHLGGAFHARGFWKVNASGIWGLLRRHAVNGV